MNTSSINSRGLSQPLTGSGYVAETAEIESAEAASQERISSISLDPGTSAVSLGENAPPSADPMKQLAGILGPDLTVRSPVWTAPLMKQVEGMQKLTKGLADRAATLPKEQREQCEGAIAAITSGITTRLCFHLQATDAVQVPTGNAAPTPAA